MDEVLKARPSLDYGERFFNLYFEIYIQPDLSSPNGIFERFNLDNMVVFHDKYVVQKHY